VFGMSDFRLVKGIILGISMFIICMLPLFGLAYLMDYNHTKKIIKYCKNQLPIICYTCFTRYVSDKFPHSYCQPILVDSCKIEDGMLLDESSGLLFNPCQCEPLKEGR
jgi:hypothetical protein